MKLELKHLAPYLPYRLKITPVWIMLYMGGHNQNELDTFILDSKGLKDIVPILRPLSDLTKEIEHNGEKFMPTIWFRDNYYKFGVSCEDMKTLISMFIYTFKSPLSAPYYFIDKLLEWHFDIFGLIKNGLAIDINTLKK